MTSAVEPASDLAAGRTPKNSRRGITGILTLRVGLTIILYGESTRKTRGVRQETRGVVVRTTPRSRLHASGELARGGRRLRGLHRLCIAGGETFAPVVGNRAIDDGAAVDALPCVEDQKEVGEPLEHHEPFAFRTFHRVLPGCGAQLWASKAKAEPIFVDT